MTKRPKFSDEIYKVYNYKTVNICNFDTRGSYTIQKTETNKTESSSTD